MFERIVTKICRSSLRHPWLWILASLALAVPAGISVQRNLRLNTDLTRLLPEKSSSVRWSQELRKSVGDGGVFSVLFEGEDPKALLAAQEAAAGKIARLPEVRLVDYRYPVDFIRKFGYLLVPADALQRLFDVLVSWKAEASPLGLKLEDPSQGKVDLSTEHSVKAALQLFTTLPEVHQSTDGKVVGMLVYPWRSLESMGALFKLMDQLNEIAGHEAKERGLWFGLSASLRNRVEVFNRIIADITNSGITAGIGLVLVLALSFRSLRVIPVLMFPLLIGLACSSALIPVLVGELNTITSFLLMILLGMGVEFTIHLVKRFQAELLTHSVEEALMETFLSTGRSILTSGLTTAAGMVVLLFSGFRGFSEYGIISGSSILAIVLSVLVFLPATIVLGHRHGMVQAYHPRPGRFSLVPSSWATGAMGAGVAACVLLALTSLRFDYDFSELGSQGAEGMLAREKHALVYPQDLTPAAIYVARDLPALDAAMAVLEKAKAEDMASPTLGRLASLRDYAPSPEEAAQRRHLLAELQERLQGRWIRRVKDPNQKSWIESVLKFAPPAENPTMAEVPPALRQNLEARDGSGELLLGVYPSVERKLGRNAMAFTSDLRALKMPEGVRGPTGETTILAEILEIVTHEGPWLVALTFLCITGLVLWDCQGSAEQTFWILLPLVAGIVLTLGSMAALGWKLNFFNIIVLPNLIGMSVDSGVHFYHRWQDLGRQTEKTQVELLGPFTSSMLTTIVGYASLLLAHHQGLQSIARVAVLGVLMCWAASTFLMAGMLRLLEKRRSAVELLPLEGGAPPLVSQS